MNAIVLRSPRSLAKPRRVEIVKHTPAVATVFQGVATAIVGGFQGVTALAVRVRQAFTAPREARWVNARQIDTPQLPPPVVPALPAEPRQVKVHDFLPEQYFVEYAVE